jgi:hypothetical protein
MKKLISHFNRLAAFAVIAAIVAQMSVAPAFATTVTETANKFPSSQGGLKHENLNFQGVKVKRVSATATAKLLVTGQGFLDAICAFGGVSGKYSLAFDTGSEHPTNGADLITATDIANYAISPRVYTVLDTGSALGGNLGCWFPPAPIKFVNGLYGANNDSGHTALFLVHCADGTNPCAP